MERRKEKVVIAVLELNGLVLLQPDMFLPNRAPPRRRL